MERMTIGMFVALSDDKLKQEYGDTGRILSVKTEKKEGVIMPVKFSVTSMAGNVFEAMPHQVSPY